jgi:hypothetical protein
MCPDPFRELTPEEAEQAWADAPEEHIPPERMAALLRMTMIDIGAVPVADMTDDEFWGFVCRALRRSRR